MILFWLGQRSLPHPAHIRGNPPSQDRQHSSWSLSQHTLHSAVHVWRNKCIEVVSYSVQCTMHLIQDTDNTQTGHYLNTFCGA